MLAYLISEANRFVITTHNNGIMPDIMFGFARYIVIQPVGTDTENTIVNEIEFLERYEITCPVNDRKGRYCVEEVSAA